MSEQNIVLSELDYVRLNRTIESEVFDLLEIADVTNCACIPSELITMNTKLLYLRLPDQTVSEVTLVYPEYADTSKNKISVLSPIGRALIGRSKNEIVTVSLPDGRETSLKVLEILYQPEASGDFTL